MRTAVEHTEDLDRVLALPRRRVTLDGAEAWARELSPMLRTSSGVRLRAWQGMALGEALESGGLFLGMPVGGGKTLLSWLLGIVLDSFRPCLFVPAALREKTFHDFAQIMKVWHIPSPPPMVRSYEELTRKDNLDLLDRIGADLLVLDECDLLRDVDRSAVRRIDRYVVDRDPKVVAMTGTPGRLSILDYQHILCWCLKELAPVPLNRSEAETWAGAIDEKPPRVGKRPDLGALVKLGGDGTLVGTRKAFRARLVETPGVLIVDGDSCDQPLTFRQILAPEDAALDAAFQVLREEWTTPDGWPLSTGAGKNDPLSMWRHAGTLGTGLYLKWDPRPPSWWLEPRAEYCSWVRKAIQADRRARPLDTEAAVREAYPDEPRLLAWDEVREDFKPNSVPVWLTSSCLNKAADWLATEGPGLVWCGNVAFGRALAKVTGLTYYGAEGLSDGGQRIEAARPDRGAVVSLGSNRRGRNLQAWNRALLVNPDQSARYVEQVTGRQHRSGQLRGVQIDWLVSSGDVASAFEAAIREASFGQDTNGITQKILRADIQRVRPKVTESNAFRWAMKG